MSRSILILRLLVTVIAPVVVAGAFTAIASAALRPGDILVGLTAFSAVVRLFAGRGIPAALAAEWIADANRIRAVLRC